MTPMATLRRELSVSADDGGTDRWTASPTMALISVCARLSTPTSVVR
jgi:hypothetical protein